MSENSMPEETANPSRRRWLGYSLAGLAGAVTGGVAWQAVANGGAGGPFRAGFGCGGWGHRAALAAGGARARAEHYLDFVLYRVDATPGQRDQIQAIVGDAVDELMTIRDDAHGDRGPFIAEMTGPNIDRQALEGLRARQLDLADQASAVALAALADSAEILTQEQRTQLGEYIGGNHFP